MNVAAPDSRPKVSSPTAEERANDLERRRELGQFFTPPNVAEFMWAFLESIHSGRFHGAARVIDPACGDCVFLRVVHQRGYIRAESLFGADIDETLVPAWRRDPLLKAAHVGLGNGLLDHPASGIREGNFDIVIGNPPFSGKGVTEVLRLLEDDSHGERHEEQDLFGALSLKEDLPEARAPLSRPERAELDFLVRSLSNYACWRFNAAENEDEAPDLMAENASNDLLAGLILNDRRRPTVSDYEKAAQLIGNWPADRMLDVSRPEIREVIGRIASTAIEVFFTERFVRLAKPGALIAVIVPESIVASDRLSLLRRWLTGRMDLLASVGLPQKVFTGVGANAKTTILFARRRLTDRPNGWWLGNPDELPDAKRRILMVSPRLDSPEWNLDNYLNSILQSVHK